MISSTLRQKFIYNTPFDDDEYPLVKLDLIEDCKNPYEIKASSLYFIDEKRFNQIVNSLQKDCDSVVIIDDYEIKSQNGILQYGIKAYILAFSYLFKKQGFKCCIKK